MDINKSMRAKLNDKLSVVQVIGCIIKNPLFLTEKECVLKPDDFPERFHQIVFGAVEYLISQGLEKISAMDIDQFLIKYESQYRIFSDNQGMVYINKAVEVAQEGSFSYYYTILKKYSLLNKLYEQGFDISEVYDTSLTDPEAIGQMQNKFNNMSVNDIINLYDSKLIGVTQDFNTDTDMVRCDAGSGLKALKEELKRVPDMGVSLCSPKMTTIARGRRLKKFYMGSSYQGGGKSRECAGEACHLSVPQYYDTYKKKWVNTQLKESVLYISIELEPDELQTLFMAYVSGVPEDHILDGMYEEGEEKRVDKAIEYIEKSNLHIVRISNFNTDDIEKIIKMHKQKYNVRYVFYDYIGTSVKIMAEAAGKTSVKGLREDQILLMMATRIKDLCNKLNLHVHAMTQVNGEWKTTKDADQNLLRGAKSLADKTDIGYIMLPVRDSDQDVIASYLRKGFVTPPNMVKHIYKVRRGKIHNVRLYINFDFGTCRAEDCFVTDKDGKILNVESTNIEILLTQAEDKIENVPFEF